MERDILFILHPEFEDPAYPQQAFFCWHCLLLEGMLASYPALLEELDVRRVAWPRPRPEVIEYAGEENQSLPLLVLGKGKTSSYQSDTKNGRVLINDKDKIFAVLNELYGIPIPHP